MQTRLRTFRPYVCLMAEKKKKKNKSTDLLYAEIQRNRSKSDDRKCSISILIRLLHVESDDCSLCSLCHLVVFLNFAHFAFSLDVCSLI